MHVYREDVVRVTPSGISLQTSEVEDVDAIVCATGWRPSYEPFFDIPLAIELGLSISTKNTSTDSINSAHWKAEDQAAEAEIARRFPRLQDPPHHYSKATDLSPFRLYRNMLPTNPDKHPGILFLGHIAVGNNFRAAEVQALWAVAYLSGMLTLPTQAEMERDVALTLAWCRKRYLTKGYLGHWLYYDLVPYTDRLLEDVGLSSHRRSKGRIGDFWKPCVARDLEGLLEELKGKKRGQKPP